MSFLAPWMLLGLFALAIPPILHLLNRREAKPVAFPAMEFLRRAYRKNARRIKMKQWLLLALRIALFAMLALALSQPIWSPRSNLLGESGVDPSELKGTQVIILDTSYSLAYQVSPEGRTLFDLARSHALRALSERDAPMALIVVGDAPRSVTQDLTADHDLLAESLRQLKVGEHVGDLGEATRLAYRMLRERPRDEAKSVTLLSAPSRYLEALPSAPVELGEVKLVKVDLSAELSGDVADTSSPPESSGELPVLSERDRARLVNHALLDLKLTPAPHMGEGQWRAEVRVAHYGDQPLTLWPIWVEIEGEVKVRGFVSLQPGEIGVKRLYFRAERSSDSPESSEPETSDKRGAEEGLRGWVKLAPDALPSDDQRPFWIEPAPPIKVLALNGDPRPTPQDDELFYLEKALAPEVIGRDRLSLMSRPTTRGELDPELLEGVDVIILANVPRPSAELGAQLKKHLERGGGVWLAPGARAQVSVWNQALRDLLPRPLRGARRAGDAAASLESRGAARFAQIEGGHPLFKPFDDVRRSNLNLASIQQYMLFDPEPPPRSEVVVTLNEGVPFMITREVGEGRVVLWASPLDREWADLVIRPDFVPLAAQTIRYLTREERGALTSVLLNEKLQIELNGSGPFSALSPRGDRRLLTRGEGRGTSAALGWTLDRVHPVGHHQVIAPASGASASTRRGADRELIARRFVVGLNPKISEIRAVSPSAEGAPSADSVKDQATVVSALAQRRELWHIGLIGLLLFALLEGVTLFQRRDERGVS